jgi:hypothetical protein
MLQKSLLLSKLVQSFILFETAEKAEEAAA